MRESLTSKKSPQPEEKKKPIQKNKLKPKILKYKPSVGEEQKNWAIEAIVNDRVTLKPKQNASQSDRQNIFTYEKVKEYEIAWVQDRKEGLWPNTWEPQEHIPEEIRLDYLLSKRFQQNLYLCRLNKKKSKSTDARLKTKESLENHIRFTMNRYKIGQRHHSLQVRRKEAMKMIQRQLSEKSAQKVKKQVNYKDWYLCFSSKIPEYSSMIYRFLKNQRNKKDSKKQLSEKKGLTLKNIKKQFIESNPILKDHKSKDEISELAENQENISNKSPNNKEDNLLQYLPRDSCLDIFREITYVGQYNNMQCFMLKLNDGSFGWIFEDDLAKYFTWIYQKLFIQAINQEINESTQKIQNLDITSSEGARWFQRMSHQIGITQNYFWELEKQFGRKNRFCRSSNLYSNDFSFSMSNNHSMGESKPQIHMLFDENRNESLLLKEMKQMKTQKVIEIQQHFKSLEKKCYEFQDLPIEFNYQKKSFESKQKLDGTSIFLSPKNLFPSDSNLLTEWKKTKTQKQNQKLAGTKKEMRQSSVKFESQFERSEKSSKKIQSTLKLQTNEHKLQAKKKKNIIKSQPSIEINEDTNKSSKEKKLNKVQKRPQKKVKLTNEQDQINEILGCMEETPTKKRKDSFYDSEEESSKK